MEVTLAEKLLKSAEKVDETPVQKLARLDAERAEILASAKSDALQKANEALAELNALGFHYHLSEEAPKTNATKRGSPTGKCSRCNFATDPPHDVRSHRGQKPQRAFTAEEVSAKGWTIVT